MSSLKILLVLLITAPSIRPNNLCTEDFCSAFRESPKCDQLAEPCKVQNQTHNGRIFPSATPCACCEICIENQRSGEDCSIGSPSLPLPNAICGPGLYCAAQGKKHPICVPMTSTSECFTRQGIFDRKTAAGTVGHLEQRPRCDDDGNFERILCVPGQNCFCVDESGERIFGDFVFSQDVHHLKKCECSRLHHKLKEMIDQRFPLFSTRCQADGSFDRLQCFEELCVCVDPRTGAPTSQARNSSLGMQGMPCCEEFT